TSYTELSPPASEKIVGLVSAGIYEMPCRGLLCLRFSCRQSPLREKFICIELYKRHAIKRCSLLIPGFWSPLSNKTVQILYQRRWRVLVRHTDFHLFPPAGPIRWSAAPA